MRQEGTGFSPSKGGTMDRPSGISSGSGKELALYNLHLSAYTSDGTIAEEQLEMLFADMLSGKAE